MLGAIVGDMVGSPYEFGWDAKTTDFELFSDESGFTDDTVMTLAVGQALLDVAGDATAAGAALVAAMRDFGRRYPHPKGGYGGRFAAWLQSPDPAPYGSFGNGSAMRVSAVGWLFDTLDDVERWAAITARVTHNHHEGVKGARATAAAIFLARTQGPSATAKAQLRAYLEERFEYNLSRTLDQIRPGYHHVESCQETVPEAITAYLEADGFEQTVRLAVSLGGDADTLGAIAGSIAEAAYGVPPAIRDEALRRLPGDLRAVLDRFASTVEQRTARRLWSLLAPYAQWLDSRPTTQWTGVTTTPDGVVTPAFPVYDERVRRLEEAFYTEGLMDHGYVDTLRQYAVTQPSPEVVAGADGTLLRAMCTWIWRGEHFGDGHIAEALDSGLLAGLARRARELAGADDDILGDGDSSLGDGDSSLGDGDSSLGDGDASR
ncbi:MAG: ADP-ribosylglycohydrolase family protein [Micrococcales bacterium]|nr:ADP-ribosylglycohydrolase family protein [Micrococcales bacterium]